jgi:endonuclease III
VKGQAAHRDPVRRAPSGDARERIHGIVQALRKDRPTARIELDHSGPFDLLLATILSAQCTDERVNKVMPEVLRRWPTPAALSTADTDQVEEVIRSTGFFRAKARALIGCSRAIQDRHDGVVPQTMEMLTALPGVGRKTANVLLGVAYGVASGVVVDTHVARVCRRLGLTRHSDPVRIEADLMALLPRSDWRFFSVAMVLHGRYVCLARTPLCEGCALSPLCPSRGRVAPRGRPRPPRGRGRG